MDLYHGPERRVMPQFNKNGTGRDPLLTGAPRLAK